MKLKIKKNRVSKTIFAIIHLFVVTVLFCSCAKPDDTTTTTPTTPTPQPPIATETIVAAGNATPLSGGGFERAIIWNYGVGTYLTPANKNSTAFGFDVSNLATVVCGTTGFGISGPDVTRATLWLNTTQTILEANSPDYSEARAVHVANGGLVYTVGSTTLRDSNNITASAATLWQGTSSITKTLLTTQNEINNGATSAAYGVDIVGNDVYVAGLYKSSSVTQAVFWKNGVKKDLTTTFGSNACANAIEVTNNIVYVTGYITVANKKQATLWIYNEAASLIPQEITVEAATFNGSDSIGLSIFNTGSITYVYGINNGSTTKSNCFGRRWKYENNVIVDKYFGEEELTTTLCDVYSGYMSTNVSTTTIANLAAGFVRLDGKTIPCFWKNNGNRTNIEAIPTNNGVLIGVRIL